MIFAITETAAVALTVAAIGALSSIITVWISHGARREAIGARTEARQANAAVNNTEDGEPTLAKRVQGMEVRQVRLEERGAAMATDLGETRKDVREIRDDIRSLIGGQQ